MAGSTSAQNKHPRLAVRAIILREGKLLLVNAWPGGRSDLLCAPGGGVERGASLPDNLAREVWEETGLGVTVGAPCLVNEFHDPKSGFHQVEIFFRCDVIGSSDIAAGWQDPEEIVSEHYWLTEAEAAERRIKPAALPGVAFGRGTGISYDPLERVVF